MKKYFIYTLILCIMSFSLPSAASANEFTVWMGDNCINLSNPLLTDNHGTYIHVEDLEQLGFQIENLSGDFLLNFQENKLFITERSNIVCLDGEEFFYPYPTSGQKYISINIIRDVYCMDTLKTQQELDEEAQQEVSLLSLEEEEWVDPNEYDDCGNIIAKEEDHAMLFSDDVQLMSSYIVYRYVTLSYPGGFPDDIYVKVNLTPEYNTGVYGGNIYDGYIYRGPHYFEVFLPEGAESKTYKVAIPVSYEATLKGFLVNYSLRYNSYYVWEQGYYTTSGTSVSPYAQEVSEEYTTELELIKKQRIAFRAHSPAGFEKSYFSAKFTVEAEEGFTGYPITSIAYADWGGTTIYGTADSPYAYVSLYVPGTTSYLSIFYDMYDCPESIISHAYFGDDNNSYSYEDRRIFYMDDFSSAIPSLTLVTVNEGVLHYDESSFETIDFTSSSSRNDYVYLQFYNATEQELSASVMIGLYSSKGTLLHIINDNITISPDDYTSAYLMNDYNYRKAVAYAKLMVWNDTLHTMAKPSKIQ